jgi:hypothetical protein
MEEIRYIVEKVDTLSIRVSRRNYEDLRRLAGELQRSTGRKVTLDGALTYLLLSQRRSSRAKDIIGVWRHMTEGENRLDSAKEIWFRWNLKV